MSYCNSSNHASERVRQVAPSPTPDELAQLLRDEELIDELLERHRAIGDEAARIRGHANAVVRLLEQAGSDIGRRRGERP